MEALYWNDNHSNLVAIGDSALRNNGLNATQNFHGTANTALGSKALMENTIGRQNTGLGYAALRENISGSGNTALGYNSLTLNESGTGNTAAGHLALFENIDGSYNTAFGYDALRFNDNGSLNAALGHQALYNNLSGKGNIGIGYKALTNNSTGFHNSGVGREADVNNSGYSYAGAFGAFSLSTATNKTVIARNALDQVIGGYASWSDLSDGRFKEEVRENVPGMEFIRELRPVTYRVKLEDLQRHITSQMPDTIARKYYPSSQEKAAAAAEVQSGFIAQEVEAAAQKVDYNFIGVNAPKNETDYYSIAYAKFVPSIVKALQEQEAKMEKIQDENQALEEKVNALQKENQAMHNEMQQLGRLLESFEQRLVDCCSKSKTEFRTPGTEPVRPRLDQNLPNPFDQETRIGYYIPETVENAQLQIFSANGLQVELISIDTRHEGSTTLEARQLNPGIYFYSLILDGQLFDTKQMILIRS